MIGVEKITGLLPTNSSALKISVLAYQRDIAKCFVRTEIWIIRVLFASSVRSYFVWLLT